PATDGSSGRANTKPPNPFAYSSARLISPACCTLRNPSEKATAPANRMSYSSASDSPLHPLLRAPTGCTSTGCSLARLTMSATPDWLSMGGTVLGCNATPVKPPAIAAAHPLRISSLVSWPGSPNRALRSKKPGLRNCPAPLMVVVLESGVMSDADNCLIFPRSIDKETFLPCREWPGNKRTASDIKRLFIYTGVEKGVGNEVRRDTYGMQAAHWETKIQIQP